MIEIDLVSLFQLTNYSYELLQDELFIINSFTKTRIDPTKIHITQHHGIEQSFLLVYIADKLQASNFLEIGTGRGTASYSISLLPNIQSIHTYDIIPFTKKRREAIHFKESFCSNQDLYEMIPFQEKSKIKFELIHQLSSLEKTPNYELSFIDGNHDNYEIIYNDFLNCNRLTTKNGVIVFDDYRNFPVVTQVVDDLQKQYTDYLFILVPFRGHLFMKDKQDNHSGEVIVFKNPKMAETYFNIKISV